MSFVVHIIFVDVHGWLSFASNYLLVLIYIYQNLKFLWATNNLLTGDFSQEDNTIR
jgi:hypothetical protein